MTTGLDTTPKELPAIETVNLEAIEQAATALKKANEEDQTANEQETEEEIEETSEEEVEETSETAVEEPEGSGGKDSSFLAEASRRERLIVEDEKRLREEKAAFERDKKQSTSVEDFKTLLTSDPVAALESLGTSFDAITNTILESPESSAHERELNKLQEQVNALTESRQADITATEQAQQQKDIDDHLISVEQTAKDGGNDFSLVSSNWDEAKEIYYEMQRQYAAQTYKDNGEAQILDVSDALGQVEDYYVEMAQKLFGIDKVKELYKNLSEGKETVVETPVEKKKSNPKTLKNSQTATVVKRKSKEGALLTEDERLDGAFSAFKQGLSIG